MILQSIIDTTELIDNISKSGPNNVTGWGLALLLSICFNYVIYREFKFIQGKLLTHLDNLNLGMERLISKFENHKND